ncbi:hypothetical protein D3C85_517150 [compost metagenome]
MDIYAKLGTTVVFVGKSGHTYSAKNILTIGAKYTVDHVHITDVGSALVSLKELPNRYFNTSLFEGVE